MDDTQKLILASDGSTQLFDLKQDPREEHNVADAQPEDVHRLKEAQQAWRQQVLAPEVQLGSEERQQRKQAEDQTQELKNALEALGYVQ